MSFSLVMSIAALAVSVAHLLYVLVTIRRWKRFWRAQGIGF